MSTLQKQKSSNSVEHVIAERRVDIASQSKLCSISDAIVALQSAQSEQDETVIAASLSLVASLARGNAETRAELRDSGAGRLIASILHFKAGSKIVSEKALQALCRLIKDGQDGSSSIIENIDYFSTVDGCKDIVNILAKHSDSDEILLWVFISMCCLSINDSKRARFGQAGAIEQILLALTKRCETVELCEMALKAIVFVIADNDANKVRLRNADGFEIVIIAMRKYIHEEAVVEQGLLIIIHLSTTEKGFKSQLGACGACEVVVEVMSKHDENPYLLDLGCICIANLALNNDRNKTKFRVNSACEQLVRILRTHATQVSAIAEHATSAVAALCVNNSSLKTKFGGIGTCEWIIEILRKYVNNSNVCATACKAAAALSCNNETNKVKFVVQLDIIVDIMRQHVESVAMAESGCWALSALSSLISRHGNVTMITIATRIVEVMKKHEDHAGVCEHGCQAIVNISALGTEASLAMIEVGCSERVIITLKKFLQNEVVAEQALKATLNLCLPNETSALKYGSPTVIEFMVGIIRQFMQTSMDISLVGFKLLVLLAVSYQKSFLGRLGAAGAADVVIEVMKTHHANAEIQELGCILITNLARLVIFG